MSDPLATFRYIGRDEILMDGQAGQVHTKPQSVTLETLAVAVSCGIERPQLVYIHLPVKDING
jgi:hypothetical protein